VEVHYDEGIAIYIGPEPCVGLREGVGEASAGECIGQPLSRERMFPESRRCQLSGRQHEWVRYRERPVVSAWSQTLACAEASCTGTGSSLGRPDAH